MKYLITYSDGVILSVTEAPAGGVIVSGTNYIIDTLENARVMMTALGIDVSKLDSVHF